MDSARSILVLLLYNVLYANSAMCPARCECDNIQNYRRARCNNQNLVNVDTAVPSNVQILDLADNTIDMLENRAFLDLNFTSIYNLTLSHNAIHTIDLNALEGLNSLNALDLSYNRLRELPAQLFWYNPNLKILNLRGNRFWDLQSPFLDSKSLTVLDMSRCQINHIHDLTFSKLPELTELNLRENMMIQIRATVIVPLLKLQKLDINENAWQCNGLVLELHEVVKQRQIEMETQCSEASSKPKMFEKMMIDPNINEAIEDEKHDKEIDWDKDMTPEVTTLSMIEAGAEPIDDPGLVSFRTNFNKNVPADFSFAAGLIIGIAISVLMYFCMNHCCVKIRNKPTRTVEENEETSNLISNRFLELSVDTPPAVRRFSNLTHLLVPNPTSVECGEHRGMRTARIRNSWQYINFSGNSIPEENIPPGTPPPSYRQVMTSSN